MADITPELLERLEEYATAATPGPWTSIPGNADSGTSRGQGHVLTSTPEDWTRGVIAISHVFHARDAADWAHIAAASPDVVLALVAKARRLAAIRSLLVTEDDGPLSPSNLSPRALLREISQQDVPRVRDFNPFAPMDQLPADIIADVATERGLAPLPAKHPRAPTVRETLARQAPVMEKLAAVERLEREVERLRRLGLKAIDRCKDGGSRSEIDQIRAEIERKP